MGMKVKSSSAPLCGSSAASSSRPKPRPLSVDYTSSVLFPEVASTRRPATAAATPKAAANAATSSTNDSRTLAAWSEVWGLGEELDIQRTSALAKEREVDRLRIMLRSVRRDSAHMRDSTATGEDKTWSLTNREREVTEAFDAAVQDGRTYVLMGRRLRQLLTEDELALDMLRRAIDACVQECVELQANARVARSYCHQAEVQMRQLRASNHDKRAELASKLATRREHLQTLEDEELLEGDRELRRKWIEKEERGDLGVDEEEQLRQREAQQSTQKIANAFVKEGLERHAAALHQKVAHAVTTDGQHELQAQAIKNAVSEVEARCSELAAQRSELNATLQRLRTFGSEEAEETARQLEEKKEVVADADRRRRRAAARASQLEATLVELHAGAAALLKRCSRFEAATAAAAGARQRGGARGADDDASEAGDGDGANARVAARAGYGGAAAATAAALAAGDDGSGGGGEEKRHEAMLSMLSELETALLSVQATQQRAQRRSTAAAAATALARAKRAEAEALEVAARREADASDSANGGGDSGGGAEAPTRRTSPARPPPELSGQRDVSEPPAPPEPPPRQTPLSPTATNKQPPSTPPSTPPLQPLPERSPSGRGGGASPSRPPSASVAPPSVSAQCERPEAYAREPGKAGCGDAAVSSGGGSGEADAHDVALDAPLRPEDEAATEARAVAEMEAASSAEEAGAEAVGRLRREIAQLEQSAEREAERQASARAAAEQQAAADASPARRRGGGGCGGSVGVGGGSCSGSPPSRCASSASSRRPDVATAAALSSPSPPSRSGGASDEEASGGDDDDAQVLTTPNKSAVAAVVVAKRPRAPPRGASAPAVRGLAARPPKLGNIRVLPPELHDEAFASDGSPGDDTSDGASDVSSGGVGAAGGAVAAQSGARRGAPQKVSPPPRRRSVQPSALTAAERTRAEAVRRDAFTRRLAAEPLSRATLKAEAERSQRQMLRREKVDGGGSRREHAAGGAVERRTGAAAAHASAPPHRLGFGSSSAPFPGRQ